MNKINIIALLSALMLGSCSTLKKTMLYSSVGGALLGGFIGRSLSPDKDSDNFNTAIGGAAGVATTAALAYFLYKEARPDLKLKSVPLKNDIPLMPIEDTSLSLGALRIAPPMEPISEKKLIRLPTDTPKEVMKSAKRQYYRKHRTKEMIYEEDGKRFKVPSFEVIESGVE